MKKLGGQYPAVILTGARQTGKTTLLRELYPNHKYISLDLASDAELAENDPEQFFKLVGNDNVIIDEAQYAPKMFRYLKILIDKNRKSYGKFILTGSQKFNLMKEVADSLAGLIWNTSVKNGLTPIYTSMAVIKMCLTRIQIRGRRQPHA